MGYLDGFLVQQASASRNPVMSVISIVTHKESEVLDMLQKLNFKLCVHARLLSCVQLFATPWTAAHQVLLPMGFPRQEYWSGLLFPPPPRDLHNPEIKPASPALVGRFFTTAPPEKPSFKLEVNRAQSTFPSFPLVLIYL